MRSHKTIPVRLFVSCALLLGSVLPAMAQRFDHEEVMEQRFAASAGQTLFLDSDLGSVAVQGDGDEIVVRVVKGANDVDKDEAQEYFARFNVAFKETSRGLEVTGKHDGSDRWWRRNRLQVHYEITVPPALNLELETAGGSISVTSVRGDARLETSGGSLQLTEVGGIVTAHTSGGSISAERLGQQSTLNTSGGSITVREAAGPLDVNTSGGSIRLSEVAGSVRAHTSGGSITLQGIAGAVDAHTSGGSIEAELTVQPDAPVTMETSGGSVTLHLNPDVRANLMARASGGRVRLDLPVQVQGEIKREQVEGTLNGGGPMITLKSSGGSVNVRPR